MKFNMKKSVLLLALMSGTLAAAQSPEAPATQEAAPPSAEAASASSAASAPAQETPVAAPYRYSGVVAIKDDLDSAEGQKLPDPALRVVSKSDRSKDVALLAVGALFGSFRTLVSKENYKGERVDAMPHPAGRDLVQKLEPVIDDWISVNAQGRSFKRELKVRQDRYQLVYRDGSGDEVFYDLTIQATISRKLDSAGYFTWPKAFTCSWADTTSRYTLADWQADDYAKVKAAGSQFVDGCVKTAQAQLSVLLAP
jgi:hypothetical protein